MNKKLNNKLNENVVFVVPQNDGEALRITMILKAHNFKVLETAQKWGASWDNLEASVKEELEVLQNSHHIYGVELKGAPLYGGKNVDHHWYDGDDRTNDKSSLEQVAELIGYKMSLEDKFISANDKAYIPGMYALGEALAMPQEEIAEMVSKVRALDRAAQGISLEQEAVAEEAIAKMETINEHSYMVRMSHSKTATVCDRLYGTYKNLLILSEDGEVNFFGQGEIICALKDSVQGSWSGGDIAGDNGFWGGYPSDQESVVSIVKSML